jgi:isopenicillin N synthase-like dioxygenase
MEKLHQELNPEFPVLDLDNFDEDNLRYILENIGSFELRGSRMEKLMPLAHDLLQTCKEIFNLPADVLQKVPYVPFKEFHGFQDVLAESTAANAKDVAEHKETPRPMRNQRAFHVNPANPRDVTPPDSGISLDIYKQYHAAGMALLHTLFRRIAILFKIDPQALFDYAHDRISVVTTRKYYDSEENKIGIPAHSDYGYLTLIVSDKIGLDVYKDGKWIPAPADSKDLKFYINFGDFLGFLLPAIKCTAGIHRVEKVKERHMAALFQNPPKEQRAMIQGKEVEYDTYLKTPKAPLKL